MIHFSGSGSQNVGLKGQFRRFARTENVLFSIRSATKQALQRILFSLFCPSESVTREGEVEVLE